MSAEGPAALLWARGFGKSGSALGSVLMKGWGCVHRGSGGAERSGQHSKRGNGTESTSKKQQGKKTNKQTQKEAVKRKEETEAPRSFC